MEQFDFYQTKLNYEIDSWDLSEMLKSSNNVIVVDTRTTVAFALEHIPGSINVPHRTMSEIQQKILMKPKFMSLIEMD